MQANDQEVVDSSPGLPPPSPAPADGPPPPPKKSKRRLIGMVLLGVLGFAAITGGAVGLTLEYTRKPTEQELKTAAKAELRGRWTRLTAADLFPSKFAYAEPLDREPYRERLEEGEGSWTARRIGVAPPAKCADVIDGELARLMMQKGCQTVLRATYVDDSGTMAVTLGVAVMPDHKRAQEVDSEMWRSGHGIKALPFPGTAVQEFDDANRQKRWLSGAQDSPYLFLYSVGWLEKRGSIKAADMQGEFAFARQLTDAIMAKLSIDDRPCAKEGVRC